jgi:class 3 adenylate cyclase
LRYVRLILRIRGLSLTGERVERRLAAVLAADVAGFSRLSGADEEGVLARLRTLRAEVINPEVVAHDGRVFKNTGDGFLAEFRSVGQIPDGIAFASTAFELSPPPRRCRRRRLLQQNLPKADVAENGSDACFRGQSGHALSPANCRRMTRRGCVLAAPGRIAARCQQPWQVPTWLNPLTRRLLPPSLKSWYKGLTSQCPCCPGAAHLIRDEAHQNGFEKFFI